MFLCQGGKTESMSRNKEQLRAPNVGLNPVPQAKKNSSVQNFTETKAWRAAWLPRKFELTFSQGMRTQVQRIFCT